MRKEIAILDYKLPIEHIGFIMDGNRRYANKYAVSLKEAYSLGLKVFFDVIAICLKKKVISVTFYALSFDNLIKREKNEIEVIYDLAVMELRKNRDFFLEHNIKIKFVGLLYKLSPECQNAIEELEVFHVVNKIPLTVFILLAYDPEKDLSMIHEKIEKSENGAVSSLRIQHIDLIVRTGGSNRLSGFLPFQSIYADLVTLNVFWPEFQRRNLLRIFSLYQKSKKNYGK
jgi:undecaprenyl diphosphate synthase